MLSLEMSNGVFLTQKDLEKYLSECNKFIKEKYEKEKMVEFEFEEFVEKINKEINDNIIKYETIEVVVEDVIKREQISEGHIWDHYLEDSIKIRGEEEIGEWDPYGDEKRDLYIIEYKTFFPSFKSPNSNFDYVLPKYTFLEILSIKPENIKRGDKRKLELNYCRELYESLKGLEMIYYNKTNLLPTLKKTTTNNETISNKNCFVVTTVMGDTNHPVVNDFRKYRDEIILKTYFGKHFVNFYYFIGPTLSSTIKKNRFLFAISKKMVNKIHKLIK